MTCSSSTAPLTSQHRTAGSPWQGTTSARRCARPATPRPPGKISSRDSESRANGSMKPLTLNSSSKTASMIGLWTSTQTTSTATTSRQGSSSSMPASTAPSPKPTMSYRTICSVRQTTPSLPLPIQSTPFRMSGPTNWWDSLTRASAPATYSSTSGALKTISSATLPSISEQFPTSTERSA